MHLLNGLQIDESESMNLQSTGTVESYRIDVWWGFQPKFIQLDESEGCYKISEQYKTMKFLKRFK